MYYVGIDIAKRSHEVCCLSESGDILDGNSFKIANTQTGLYKLQDKFQKFKINNDNCLIGMEATGHYWLVLYSWLRKQGFSVKVINPIITDAFRKVSIRKVKNDSIDAEVIAKVLKFGEYQESLIAEEGLYSLKLLCRFRSAQVQLSGDLKRRIIALLDQVFPEYETIFSDIFCTTSAELLKNYTTPEEIAAIPTMKLEQFLKRISNGRLGIEKAGELKAAAANSIGITYGTDAFTFQIRMIIMQLQFLDAQIKEIEDKINEYMKKLNSPITTIPGIGAVYGATILSELGDIKRFPSGKQIVSFAGIDASVKESGDFKGIHNHISKRGSPYLRKALWGAAFVAVRYNKEYSEYYSNLKARGKHHNVAICAVARKLCYLIFAVLSENRPYREIL